MNALLKVLGVLMIVAGVGIGIGIDVVYFFVGGIMQMIEGVTADPVSASDIAWGAAKTFLFTGLGLFLTFILLIIPGFALVTTGSFRK